MTAFWIIFFADFFSKFFSKIGKNFDSLTYEDVVLILPTVFRTIFSCPASDALAERMFDAQNSSKREGTRCTRTDRTPIKIMGRKPGSSAAFLVREAALRRTAQNFHNFFVVRAEGKNSRAARTVNDRN